MFVTGVKLALGIAIAKFVSLPPVIRCSCQLYHVGDKHSGNRHDVILILFKRQLKASHMQVCVMSDVHYIINITIDLTCAYRPIYCGCIEGVIVTVFQDRPRLVVAYCGLRNNCYYCYVTSISYSCKELNVIPTVGRMLVLQAYRLLA